MVKNSTCLDVNSITAVVVINESPKITTQPAPLSIICKGSPLNLVVETTGTNLTYQWQLNNVNIPNPGAIPNVFTLTGQLTDSGNYICIITSPSCPAIISRVARVIVRDLPVVNSFTASNGTICSGSTSEINFNGTPSAVVTYTINGGSNQTIVLNQAGTAILQTGILTSTAVYTLVSVASNDNPSCTQTFSNLPPPAITINVIPMPRVSLDKDGYICIDSLTNTLLKSYLLDTGLDPLQYTFQWYWNNTAITTPILADQPSYEVKAIGTYKVAVTSQTTPACMREATAIISQSSPPEIASAEVVSNYFADNATIQITASPMGVYEYALDYGPFQPSSIFEAVETGTHIIHVRDLKACAEVTTTVSVVDFPKYFTPNGDGFNDTWNISALSNQPFAVIYIYDRAGKLLKQISTTGLGWDGTFNNQLLPADDYWFTVNYTENGEQRIFKAHFAIKR